MSRQHLGQKSGQGSCLGSGSLSLNQGLSLSLFFDFFFISIFSV